MINSTHPKTCVICADPAPLTCTTCKDATYCTPECQRVDHRIHRLLCPSLSLFPIPPKPTQHLAILFSPNKSTPEFIWIDFRKDEHGIESPTSKSLNDVLGGESQDMLVEFNAVRARRLGDLITLFLRKGTEMVGLGINECVRRVVAKGKRWLGEDPVFPWRGNLLFIVQNGNELYDRDNPTTYRDARTRDFRNIVDFLSTYEPKPFGVEGGIEPEWSDRARKLKGVHMQCRENGAMTCTQKSYPLDYPFLVKTSMMGESTPDKLLDMELMFFGEAVDKELEAKEGAKEITTQVRAIIAAIIPGTADPNASYARKQFNYHVVRRDANNLLPEHMEAFCEFVLDLLLGESGKVDSYSTSRMDKGLKMEVWKPWFLKFREERGLGEEFPVPWEMKFHGGEVVGEVFGDAMEE